MQMWRSAEIEEARDDNDYPYFCKPSIIMLLLVKFILCMRGNSPVRTENR